MISAANRDSYNGNHGQFLKIINIPLHCSTCESFLVPEIIMGGWEGSGSCSFSAQLLVVFVSRCRMLSEDCSYLRVTLLVVVVKGHNVICSLLRVVLKITVDTRFWFSIFCNAEFNPFWVICLFHYSWHWVRLTAWDKLGAAPLKSMELCQFAPAESLGHWVYFLSFYFLVELESKMSWLLSC